MKHNRKGDPIRGIVIVVTPAVITGERADKVEDFSWI